MASSQYASVPATNGTTLEASRKTNPTSTAASTAAAALATTPVSPKAPANLPPLLASKLPSLTPHTPLTGAAAVLANKQQSRSPRTMTLDDKKTDGSQAVKQSPNPASIFTTNLGMSTPADAPPKEPSPVPSGLGGLPSVAAAAAAMDTSGSSPATSSGLVSNGTTVDGNAGTVTTGPNTTDPALLPSDMSQYHTLQPQPPKLTEPLTATTPTTPGFGSATTPTTPFSPNNPGGTRGKHTCPHCHKTFTRHHNLKSHLLTHAHEKPFLCTTCNSRFRRLHDLKRHTKLHTGERPHVCAKCGRRFARGDALARHARGEGGCAGRRGSMGGMMNEDGTMVTGLGQDGDDMEGLEGLIDDGDGDVSMMDENGGEGSDGGPRRRASLPSIKTDFHPGHQQVGHPMGQHTPMTPASGYRTHNNTYPQLSSGARTASASGPSPGLFPPGYAAHGFKSATPASATPSMQTTNMNSTNATSPAATNSANTSILSPQNVLTDSPRAVSPGMLPSQPEGMPRDRTPSFTYTNPLPAPPRERDGMFVNHMAHPPASGQQQNAHQQQQGATGGSGPAPQANMGGNGLQSNPNMFAGQDGGLWTYIKTLEDRIKQLEERLDQQTPQQPQAQRQQQQPAASSS
ncbi:hypothetical protein DFP73DRAFT_257172 [Morchella snyderi]|nr:hypothetical protein DFP73DRAFT_257172 [Morchella snyderi]